MCTREFCRNWTETQEGRTNNCSCDHVLEKARVNTSHLLILSQQMSVDTQTRHQTQCAFLLDVVIRQIGNGCFNRRGALGPIAGQQIVHVELSPGSNNTVGKKLLIDQLLWENKR